MKPLTVLADGQGMAREKNPHRKEHYIGNSPEETINDAWVEWDKTHPSLPIYKNGQPWMGEGETQAELVWMYQNPINDVWLRCDNQMKGYDCKQIYIIPEAQEAKAGTETVEEIIRCIKDKIARKKGYKNFKDYDRECLYFGSEDIDTIITEGFEAGRLVEKEKIIQIVENSICRKRSLDVEIWVADRILEQINQL